MFNHDEQRRVSRNERRRRPDAEKISYIDVSAERCAGAHILICVRIAGLCKQILVDASQSDEIFPASFNTTIRYGPDVFRPETDYCVVARVGFPLDSCATSSNPLISLTVFLFSSRIIKNVHPESLEALNPSRGRTEIVLSP